MFSNVYTAEKDKRKIEQKLCFVSKCRLPFVHLGNNTRCLTHIGKLCCLTKSHQKYPGGIVELSLKFSTEYVPTQSFIQPLGFVKFENEYFK